MVQTPIELMKATDLHEVMGIKTFQSVETAWSKNSPHKGVKGLQDGLNTIHVWSKGDQVWLELKGGRCTDEQNLARMAPWKLFEGFP